MRQNRAIRYGLARMQAECAVLMLQELLDAPCHPEDVDDQAMLGMEKIADDLDKIMQFIANGQPMEEAQK